jgi:hypothetical protein
MPVSGIVAGSPECAGKGNPSYNVTDTAAAVAGLHP